MLPGFIEWGPVIAGALLAAALSFVLLTFGTAIGLSAVSPWPNSGLPARLVASLAVFWVMAQQIGTFMAGGYVAGRLRSRWRDAPKDEVEFRDGLHGALVWALGIAIGAALLMATAGAASRTGAEMVGRTAAAAASTSQPIDVALDAMLRPAAGQAAGQRSDDPRPQLARALAGAVAGGSLSEQSRAYLVQVVAQRTGASQEEAAKRVDEAFQGARQAADRARRAAVLTALVTAISLLVSLAAAWWAALKGGEHRDNAVPPRFLLGPRAARASR
jgi:hypothetical protein